jgi:hypothetical protein
MNSTGPSRAQLSMGEKALMVVCIIMIPIIVCCPVLFIATYGALD